jgi:formylglycine-generating enzyme
MTTRSLRDPDATHNATVAGIGLSVIVVLGAGACRPSSTIATSTQSSSASTTVPLSASPESTGTAVTSAPLPGVAFSTERGVYLPAPSERREPLELYVPPGTPFASNPLYEDCIHPGVETSCHDGWCQIPAGCYVWGSPDWEPDRGSDDEKQGPVTISRPFELSQYEVTVAQWNAAGFAVRESLDLSHCREPNCPASDLTWYQAASYANFVSRSNNPPLPECYVIDDCAVEQGNYRCETIGTTTERIYDCKGYRLPTRAEWQYAARAGTSTSYYSGDITVTEADQRVGCPEDPNLNPIAWYCYNSNDVTKPVGGKWPNAWGLYDMLGNASELLHEPDHARSPAFPATDPFGEAGAAQDGRPETGGNAIGWPSLLRVASGLQASPNFGGGLTGFRLARTLSK